MQQDDLGAGPPVAVSLVLLKVKRFNRIRARKRAPLTGTQGETPRRKSTVLFTVAMACALPFAASANNLSSSNQPSSIAPAGTAHTTTTTTVRPWSSRPVNRGGGPEEHVHAAAPAAATNANTRAEQLHAMSPHVITVQTKIDSAQAEARGIERIASLEREPLSGVYNEHLRGLERDLQSDVTAARHHLDELRSAVQSVQVNASVNNDIAAADHALQEVRTSVEHFMSGPAPQAGQPAQAGGTDARAFGAALSRDLNTAKSAMNRIERGLH